MRAGADGDHTRAALVSADAVICTDVRPLLLLMNPERACAKLRNEAVDA